MNGPVGALDLFKSRRVPFVRQTEASECGLACIAMIAGYHGLEIDAGALRRRFPISLRGSTISSLLDVGAKLGLPGRAVRLDLQEADQLRLPSILHWRMNHFVVLERCSSNMWHIVDPSKGRMTVSVEEASEAFTGVALEIAPAIGFQPAKKTEKLRFNQLWTRIAGLGSALAQAALLTVVLQAWQICAPLFMQIAVDDVLPRQDFDLLNILVVGFLIFAFINVTASYVRQLLFLSMSNLISFQVGSNVARHLLRLPIAYFEKRHAGDVMSRFSAIQPIQTFLTTGLVGMVLDGVMVAAMLILMLIYSPTLTAVAVAAVMIMAGVRFGTLQAMKTRNDSAIVAQAKHDTFLLETIRGITTLRLFSAETSRHCDWQSRLADIANAKQGYGKIQAAGGAISDFLAALEVLVSVFIAVTLATNGGFSIGMMYAYISYKTQFMQRASSLLDGFVNLRLLDVYMRRLSDIALSPQDRSFGQSQPFGNAEPIRGEIALDRISFRYGIGEPYVLKELSLRIKAGEHVAIVGPSGSGKTTLIKLILGLITPEAGTIAIDGAPLDRVGFAHYRENVAAVMQDDRLFAGSLFDNIALFDSTPDVDRVYECAKIAYIHSDILQMPMRYETLVGDMGDSLSGGQKQRLLLARALYRRPQILVLDEGTAHLDAANELAISNSIKTLGITRVVVAHRQETIKHADRVIHIEHGHEVSEETQKPAHPYPSNSVAQLSKA